MRVNDSIIVSKKRAISVFVDAVKAGEHEVIELQDNGYRPLAWLKNGVVEMQGYLLVKVANEIITALKDKNIEYVVMDNYIQKLY